MEHGAFCGVFDGHGKNGHIVSKIVRNTLPSLLLNQKNASAKMKTVRDHNNEKADDGLAPSEGFHKWKEACISAFKEMDKEIKLQGSLDCSCSGATAVVVLRQVRKHAGFGLSKQIPILVTCKGMVFICLFSHSYVFYLEKWKQGDDLITANLGDSRAVLGRINDQNGIMPVQLTTDLKPGVPGKASFLLK